MVASFSLNAYGTSHPGPAEGQKFTASYEELNFDITVVSPSTVSEIQFRQESKQLLVVYPGGEWEHFDDFQVYVSVPTEMMSGPFTATFNGMKLDVEEEQSEDGFTTLSLNGTHLDVMEMDSEPMDGGMDMGNMEMDDSGTGQNAIVITAATVVPEFPIGLMLISAIGFASILAVMIVRTRGTKLL